MFLHLQHIDKASHTTCYRCWARRGQQPLQDGRALHQSADAHGCIQDHQKQMHHIKPVGKSASHLESHFEPEAPKGIILAPKESAVSITDICYLIQAQNRPRTKQNKKMAYS